MKYKWIVPFTLALTLRIATAQTPENQATSPQEVVESFWKMETSGSRLTLDGWYRAAEFFSGRPIPPHQDKTIFVVSNYFSVNITSVTANKAEINVYTREFRKLNHRLQLEEVRDRHPNGALVVSGMWFPYKLTLSDRHWERAPDGGKPREVNGAPEWTIDGVQTDFFLNIDAAIRYVTEMRDKSTDPVVRQNADQTIATLKRPR